MYNSSNYYIIKLRQMNKIKNGLIYSFGTGFCLGLLPNKINVQINEKKYIRVRTPLIFGCISSMGFILSPVLLGNYFFEGIFFDKLFDNYEFGIIRFHQFDGNNNKYAYPSIITIDIKKKLETKILHDDIKN